MKVKNRGRFLLYDAKRIIYRILRRNTTNQNLSRTLGNKVMLKPDETNELLYNAIMSGEPFFAGRFGGFELSVMLKEMGGKFDSNSDLAKKFVNNAGFFSCDAEQVKKFVELMLWSSERLNLVGRYWNGMEDYIIKTYATASALTHLNYIEPWFPHNTIPWTYALRGKKVLIIHPFEASIQKQYEKRERLFLDNRILPEFELITLKAVQTITGERDSRFNTWFDALEYMFNEAMKKEFDVAIIGCGAYGFPLAAKLKEAGKVAIHLGGASQLLFGIKGARWENEPQYEYVRELFNEYWIYPLEQDCVKNRKSIENACYWGKTE